LDVERGQTRRQVEETRVGVRVLGNGQHAAETGVVVGQQFAELGSRRPVLQLTVEDCVI